MATINQLIKKKRINKFRSKKTGALDNCPQKRGVVIKLVTRAPKKPNSGVRKLALVNLTNNRRIYAYIVGNNNTVQEHGVVLVRGGRVQDLPGIRYKLVSGVYDFAGLENRKTSRSKYGTKRKI